MQKAFWVFAGNGWETDRASVNITWYCNAQSSVSLHPFQPFEYALVTCMMHIWDNFLLWQLKNHNYLRIYFILYSAGDFGWLWQFKIFQIHYCTFATISCNTYRHTHFILLVLLQYNYEEASVKSSWVTMGHAAMEHLESE